MKKLHKKISSVALAGMLIAGGLVGSGLSQEFVAHASSSLLDDRNDYEDFQNRKAVVAYEEKYNYESFFLDKPSKKVDIEFRDRWDLKNKLEDGVFNKYRQQESIIIRVGNCYFKIYFPISKYQRDKIIIEEYSKKYNFRVEYRLPNSSEMDALIRSNFKDRPDVMNQLLKKSIKYPDAASFKVDLDKKKIVLSSGKYYRFKIRNIDYIIYKI